MHQRHGRVRLPNAHGGGEQHPIKEKVAELKGRHLEHAVDKSHLQEKGRLEGGAAAAIQPHLSMVARVEPGAGHDGGGRPRAAAAERGRAVGRQRQRQPGAEGHSGAGEG